MIQKYNKNFEKTDSAFEKTDSAFEKTNTFDIGPSHFEIVFKKNERIKTRKGRTHTFLLVLDRYLQFTLYKLHHNLGLLEILKRLTISSGCKNSFQTVLRNFRWSVHWIPFHQQVQTISFRLR
jgi:hypothetical protein